MILKFAFRNALRQKRRSIFTILTMLGGFVLASVALAIADGSYNKVIDTFTKTMTGHIQIHAKGYLDKPSIYKKIDDYRSLGDKIRRIKYVKSWSPRLLSAGLVSVGDKSTAAKIIGIDPNLEDKATLFSKRVKIGHMFSEKPQHQAILGKNLAKNLKAQIGDTVVVLSQATDGSIANDMYKIIGIYSSGNEMADRTTMYLNLADAQELFVLPNSIQEIIIVLTNFKKTNKVLAEIKSKLNNPKLDIEPWQKIAKTFYQSMKADKQGNYIMNLVIILIVAIGVLNTVLMAVLERIREYGVLKALGTRPSQIFQMVIYETTILSIASIVIGTGLALVANYLLSIRGIKYPVPFDVGGIPIDTIVSEINLHSYIVPAVVVLITAFLVSMFPAFRAAKTDPAKTMRQL